MKYRNKTSNNIDRFTKRFLNKTTQKVTLKVELSHCRRFLSN